MNVTLCRYNDYYDYDGDWGWVTANIDEDREQFYNLDIPLTTDDWYFSVFSISKGGPHSNDVCKMLHVCI